VHLLSNGQRLTATFSMIFFYAEESTRHLQTHWVKGLLFTLYLLYDISCYGRFEAGLEKRVDVVANFGVGGELQRHIMIDGVASLEEIQEMVEDGIEGGRHQGLLYRGKSTSSGLFQKLMMTSSSMGFGREDSSSWSLLRNVLSTPRTSSKRS
jgi:hypothetical protein